MSTITVKGALYFDTSKHARLCWGTEYRWHPGPPKSFGDYIAVCPHDLTVDIGDFDPRPDQIKQLEEQRAELRAKFAQAVMEIDRRISELQAIEYSEAA